MAETRKNGLITKDMTIFKVRMYTNIPPNAVLIGHNIFTKRPKIYQKAFLHMPWFKSKFITMENHNRDLQSQKFQLGGADSGLQIVSDVAVTFRVTPIAKDMNMGFVERWRSVIAGFRNKTVPSVLKTVLLTAGTVIGGIVAWPLAIAIPAVAAGYISFFHQDEEWVKEQGAYKAAYESKAAMGELEQTIYEELRSFYASHSYDEIKGLKIDLTKPEFSDLKNKLDVFKDQYGLEVTRIMIKNADLTDDSDQILQRQKEAEMRATEIERQAQAQKAVHERNRQYAQDLLDQGFTPEQVAQIMQVEAARGSNAFINVGGGAPIQPIITMPVNPTGTGGDTNGDDQNSTGGRTR